MWLCFTNSTKRDNNRDTAERTPAAGEGAAAGVQRAADARDLGLGRRRRGRGHGHHAFQRAGTLSRDGYCE